MRMLGGRVNHLLCSQICCAKAVSALPSSIMFLVIPMWFSAASCDSQRAGSRIFAGQPVIWPGVRRPEADAFARRHRNLLARQHQ